MDNPNRIELGGFESTSSKSAPIYHRGNISGTTSRGAARYSHTRREKTRNSKTSYSLMLIKIGICAGVCAIFALLKLVDIPAITNVSGEAPNTESENDNLLGKLKFVELPGILEVFSGGDVFTVPIQYTHSELDDTSTLLTLIGKINALVTVCGEGTVKAIGEDPELGKYVVVRHSGDIETQYFGFDTITVDEGQPLKKLDTLGILDNDGKLVLKILKEGQPENPCLHLSLEPDNTRSE